jgi:2-polyprenyl-6-methoxyphenol hydroxylase-like FAD-dependent oxidoreductase
MRPPAHDAIVVGARAAGAATALLLARHGMRVLVVDRSRYGADALSTHALMRGGVLQLRRWGLLDHVIAAGTPPIRRATFIYAEDRVEIAIKPSHGVDALYAPRRTVLDPILVDAAAGAGAELRYGVTVTDVRRDRVGRVSGIVGRDDHGRAFTADADIVIGADGLRSTVAERVGAGIERGGRCATSLVYGYWSDVDADGYEWMFRPNARAGVIPTNDGLVCVFAAATPQRVGRGGMGVLESLLAEASPDTAARVRAGTAPAGVRTFGGHPGLMRRAWGPGWALVGDAGYWKDPLTAHGLTDALRDAELLARAIVAASGGASEHEALAHYQRTRDRLSLPLFTITDTIAGQSWTDADIGALLLQLSSAMVDEVEVLAGLDGRPFHSMSRPCHARHEKRSISDSEGEELPWPAISRP